VCLNPATSISSASASAATGPVATFELMNPLPPKLTPPPPPLPPPPPPPPPSPAPETPAALV